MAAKIPSKLKLDVQRDGDVAVLTLHGSAGMDQVKKLDHELQSLAAQKTPVIVLNLTDMEFICSSGLGAIIAGHLKCRHHQGQIRVVNPQPEVRNLLETTRLTKIFPIYDTVEQAMA